ncbi:sirohydrochlorin cobaltochelatase [Ancylomarina sp. 16SWW S1-10-2]|uniref:sirohydrochlorin cobaltochelatase n=1 Tax=Ancylomarina sp. 16SWW S1-10-2 TaxID=2499681 RepID=UPI0012ADF1FC|nr:sirohydrochlorin cobaltochelatase [Ancylomarina sp. 16SWW S1-10-2]MRT93833.1 hypothetical protein [Ancylomarina sp. 16SWW S1-10-2]
MFSIRKVFLILSAAALLCTSCSSDDDDKNETKIGNKEGILLVTFGSSYEAPQASFAGMDKTAKTKFAGEEIRWGFTSDLILNKLRQGNGEGALNGKIIDNDSPEEAFKLMIEEGYGKIFAQSLHVIPGEEYDELIETVDKIEAEYEGVEITVGMPLLNSDDDLVAVAKILADKFSTQIAAGEPVLFMGHGTPHVNNAKYPAMEVELQKLYKNFFVGTVEGITFENGTTSIGSIVTKLDALDLSSKNVTITPLMSIAGDHANNDMNGVTGETNPAEQSWRERLEAAGYTVTDVMKGLEDYAETRAIWLSHLDKAKAKL